MRDRAAVEETLELARLALYQAPDVLWRERYLEDVAWLLAQLDRLETERRALADVLARELVAP